MTGFVLLLLFFVYRRMLYTFLLVTKTFSSILYGESPVHFKSLLLKLLHKRLSWNIQVSMIILRASRKAGYRNKYMSLLVSK